MLWRCRLRKLCVLATFVTLILCASELRASTLAWDRNPEPDIAGYVVSYGTSSGSYTTRVDVGNVTTWTISLASGSRYFFAVQAYNTAGLLSTMSNEVSADLSETLSLSSSSSITTSSPPAPQLSQDLNGDGKPDLIWLNDSTRQAVVWYLGGSQGNIFQGWDWLSSAWIDGWTIVGMRDFNGDGQPDLVWQNDATQQVVVWYLGGPQGSSFLGWAWLAQGNVAGWHVAATGDLNGDGKPDLVWQNDATQQVVVWYLGGPQGSSFLGWAWLAQDGVAGWYVVATGDFNGDGKLDLVWQNDARQVAVWYLGGAEGTTFLWWDWLSSNGVSGWGVAGTGDFNGDGKPDLVWQNDARQVAVWYLGGAQGTTFLWWDWLGLAYNPIPGWRVIAR
jgi:VCBS repeat protein/FG-GAP repeat protein